MTQITYGDAINADQIQFIERIDWLMMVTCCSGIALQLGTLFLEPLGWASCVAYVVYNALAVCWPRMFMLILKFEEKEALVAGIRTNALICLYIVSTIATSQQMTNNGMLLIMSIAGALQACLFVPALIYDLCLLHESRSDGFGLANSRPLEGWQDVVLGLLIIVMLLILVCTLTTLVGILCTLDSDADVLWWYAFGLSIAVNMIMLPLPRITHWIQTDTKLWPVRWLIVVTSFLLLVSVSMSGSLFLLDDADLQRWFSIAFAGGTLFLCLPMAATMLHAYYYPRTTLSVTDDCADDGMKPLRPDSSSEAKESDLRFCSEVTPILEAHRAECHPASEKLRVLLHDSITPVLGE